MNVLRRYIVWEIIKGSLLALLLLTTLFTLFTFSDELKDLGVGRYGLKEIGEYLLLSTPRTIYELMPSSALLGSLFVVGAMANNREIVAMRAAGYSVFWIIRTIMLAGVFLVLMAIGVGEFIAPPAEQKAQILRAEAQYKKPVASTRYGMWLREGSRYISVEQIPTEGELEKITIYWIQDQHLLEWKSAEKAIFLGDGQWRLENVSRSTIDRQTVSSEQRKTEIWQTAIEPGLMDSVVVRPEEMPLQELYKYIQFLRENNQKPEKYELAFWGRVFSPLAIFVMLMVSVPFVVGIHRGISTGARIMMGVLIGLMFNIFDKISGHLGLVYGFNPALMALLPSVIVFLAAVFAVRRVE
jgi:lipopolysaccharide export system permease protein